MVGRSRAVLGFMSARRGGGGDGGSGPENASGPERAGDDAYGEYSRAVDQFTQKGACPWPLPASHGDSQLRSSFALAFGTRWNRYPCKRKCPPEIFYWVVASRMPTQLALNVWTLKTGHIHCAICVSQGL